jgi:Kef-type K+ transport system membrane component KefB
MTGTMLDSLLHLPGALLLLQLGTILLSTSACGWLLARLGQPRVVGEIAGGLLLGPIAFGHLLPAAALLFPPSQLHPLEIVSNISLVLFLFVIGAELDLTAIARNRGATFAITFGSIALPFALGAAISPLLFSRFGLPGVTPSGFLVFVGISMSITALPVLARIIQDRKRANHPIDSTIAAHALICAAANDVLAWSFLAITLTLLHGNQGVEATLVQLFVLAVYIGIMLFLVRPLARHLVARYPASPPWVWIPALVALAFLSAHITDALGIHAFFGAFLAGICVPRLPLRTTTLPHGLDRSLQPIIHLTLPVFFAMTGLHMQRNMFDRNGLGWLAVVLLLAVAGKIGGAALAARLGGMTWATSTRIGILLNTRGLVELIVLNIGYKEGILSPLLFTIFVLMAVITTAMTVPLLIFTERRTLTE